MKIPSGLFLEVMEEALSGPPIRLEVGAQAVQLRQRFYRVRANCWEEGDSRFAFLKFQISGTELIISRHPDPQAIRHRIRLRALREMVAFAREYRAGLEQPGSENIPGDNQEELGDAN
jgi:hypothetical protein